jgi:hypothetical protein
MTITPSEAVLHSAVFNPVVWPHGPTYYLIETATHRVGSVKQPMIRDATGKPLALIEELGVGTIMQIAIADDGMMVGIKIVQMNWADPFAVAA